MKKYFFHDGTDQLGPFDLKELKAKKITADTMIWYEGLNGWTAAGSLDELRTILVSSPPPFTAYAPPPVNAQRSVQPSASSGGYSSNQRLVITAVIIAVVFLGRYLYSQYNSPDYPADQTEAIYPSETGKPVNEKELEAQRKEQDELHFSFPYKNDFVNTLASRSNDKISRGLLLLSAYQSTGQEEVLPWDFEVEHIFPHKWQTANYNGWDEIEAKNHLNRFGNKIVFEKKLNIQAGNNYFGKKKEKYAESEIEAVRELSKYPKLDWHKQDIDERDNRVLNELMTFFTAHVKSEPVIGLN
ncbi:MAG: DUF1524 domain-containing protein [Bacteroidota bacterium]